VSHLPQQPTLQVAHYGGLRGGASQFEWPGRAGGAIARFALANVSAASLRDVFRETPSMNVKSGALFTPSRSRNNHRTCCDANAGQRRKLSNTYVPLAVFVNAQDRFCVRRGLRDRLLQQSL
jgi:hypothetical protein